MARNVILFKTYYWDDFVERQFNRLKQCQGQSDLFVVVDETNRKVSGISHDRVIRVTEQDVLNYGFADATTSESLFWYNNDYVDYFVYLKFPDYEHYICVEHDVHLTIPLDDILARVAAHDIDYVGLPIRNELLKWNWLDVHKPIYAADEITPYLNCLAIYSRRALAALSRERLNLSRQYADKTLPYWPISEAFVPKELRAAGLRIASLGAFGDVSRFDWWPPCHEEDLPSIGPGAFVHPVLAGDKYIRSILRHESTLRAGLQSKSEFRKRLQRFPFAAYKQQLLAEAVFRIKKSVKKTLQRSDNAKKWNGVNGEPRAKRRVV